MLPLQSLQLPHHEDGEHGMTNLHQNLGMTLSTGFGDILDAAFVQGYVEPVVVLLHTDTPVCNSAWRSTDGPGARVVRPPWP